MSPQVASQLEPAITPEPSSAPAAAAASIELYWLPLGAGGWFVRLNGRLWEAIQAHREHRRPFDLYHTALVVRVPEGRFVVENCWPIPDADGPARGALVEGPVFSRGLGRWRVFRYEVRCWPAGTIADADEAVASPQLVSDDPVVARRLLGLVGSLPSPVWGRDALGTGEMWNSNSVIAWLLARSGLPTESIQPPAGGRAPGWQAGLTVAQRSPGGIDAATRKETVNMLRILVCLFVMAHGLVTFAIWTAPVTEKAPFNPSHSWLLAGITISAGILYAASKPLPQA